MEGGIGYKIIAFLLRAEPPVKVTVKQIETVVESNFEVWKFCRIGILIGSTAGLSYYLIKTYKDKNIIELDQERNTLSRLLNEEKDKTRQYEKERYSLSIQVFNLSMLLDEEKVKTMQLEHEGANLVQERNSLTRLLDEEKVKTMQLEHEEANLIQERNALYRQLETETRRLELEKSDLQEKNEQAKKSIADIGVILRPYILGSNPSQDDMLCVVCLDRNKCILIRPCNHLCICKECCNQLKGMNRRMKCPLCNQDVNSTIKVFT